jgi:hypothetical protein
VENERFSVEEINEYLYSLDGSGKCGDCKYEIARFVDAKSYAIGKEEGIEIGLQAGREIAAREIFTEIENLQNNIPTWIEGVHILPNAWKALKSRYGVTE